MTIEHWMTAELRGANGSFQRAAREYAEEYAEMAVAAERERMAAELRATIELDGALADEIERLRSLLLIRKVIDTHRDVLVALKNR